MAIELLDPQGSEGEAVEAAYVDHVFGLVGPWPMERSNTAVAAKEMSHCEGAELVRFQIEAGLDPDRDIRIVVAGE